ncbi:MAG: tetratricopeptide repeat protein [Myxococcaceae bacterium]
MNPLTTVTMTLLLAAPSPELAKAESLEARAHDLQREGRYGEAEAQLKEALAIRKKRQGADHLDVLNAEMNLAVAWRRQGEAQRAVTMLERVLKALAASKGPEAAELHRKALNNLAAAYRAQSRYADAREILERVLAQIDEGPPTEERGRVLDNLANMNIQLRDYDAAEKQAWRALAEWKSLKGAEDVDVAVSMTVVGTVVMLRRRYPEARRLFEDSLRIQERVRGREHPELCAVHNMIGTLEYRESKLDAAKARFEKALAIGRKAKLTDSHPVVVDALKGLRAIEKRKAQ